MIIHLIKNLNLLSVGNIKYCRILTINKFIGDIFMDLKISDLPPQFENIAIELGIDNIKALFKNLGDISVLSY